MKAALDRKKTELKEAKAVSKTQSSGTSGWTPNPCCFPGPSYCCKAARNHAEKLQAACEGGVSLCVSIKSHTAKLAGGSLHWEFVQLEVTSPCTLENVASRGTVFLIFKASKAMAKFQSCVMGAILPASSRSELGFFFLHEKYWINPSC